MKLPEFEKKKCLSCQAILPSTQAMLKHKRINQHYSYSSLINPEWVLNFAEEKK